MNIDSTPAQRARDEIAEAWEHLISAAEHGAKQVSKGGRQARATARDRAALASLALRGERPPSPWRWLAAGLAVGTAIGAAAAAGWSRRGNLPDLSVDDVAREGRAAMETARERANQATQQATATARGTAEKVRDKLNRRREEAEEQQTPAV